MPDTTIGLNKYRYNLFHHLWSEAQEFGPNPNRYNTLLTEVVNGDWDNYHTFTVSLVKAG